MGSCPRVSGLALGSVGLLLSAVPLGIAGADESWLLPTNVTFVVDGSSSMGSCLSGDVVSNGASTWCGSTSRLAAVKSVLWELSSNAEPAFFALGQTDPSWEHEGLGSQPETWSAYPSQRPGIMAPLGVTDSAFRATLSDLTLSADDVTPLTEALRDVLYYHYVGFLHCNDPALCNKSPILYTCQANHVVLLTDGTSDPLGPIADNNPWYHGWPASPDHTGGRNASLDNIASFMYQADLSSAAGKQNLTTWVVGLDIDDPDDHDLFESTALNAHSTYVEADSYDSLRNGLKTILGTILAGSHEVQPPRITVTGDYVLVGWYDASSVTPLDRGHLASWRLDVDPASMTFGELLDHSGPAWDAGVKLRDRPTTAQELRSDTDGNNGHGVRDLFTDLDGDATPDAFDASNLSALCPLMLNTALAADPTDPQPGVLEGHDLDADGDVDLDDCAALMDFVRGLPTATYAGSTFQRGPWKLGSVRLSQPVVAEPDPRIFTRNPSLRASLASLPATLTHCPDPPGSCEARVAFVGANDGMLHAFSVATGEELWGWIPRSLLGQTVNASARLGALVDLTGGETPLMDATPTVGFAWIDGYQGHGQMGTPDGLQSPEEWPRILVVGQGMGGRYHLALDITQPDEPWLLWESTAGGDTPHLQGETTSTPAIALVADGDTDVWVEVHGSGAVVGDEPVESRLHLRALGDLRGATPTYDDEGFPVLADLDGDDVDDGVGLPSDPLVLDRDHDGDMDEVYLVSGDGVLYRFLIDDADPESVVGCRFFDPQDATLDTGAEHQVVGPRLPSLHAPTAAMDGQGRTLIYWGSGSPRDRFPSESGRLYVIDSPPGCGPGHLVTGCGGDGEITLDPGEMLVGSPVVYDGIAWFTTLRPTSDRCSPSQARLYAVESTTCAAALDTDSSGIAGDGDTLYKELGDGIPSVPVVANGSIYVALSAPGIDEQEISIHRFEPPVPLFGALVPIQWRELF